MIYCQAMSYHTRPWRAKVAIYSDFPGHHIASATKEERRKEMKKERKK